MSRWATQTSRVRVSARSRPSPPLYPHFNWPSGFWPCVKSCLVGGSDKYLGVCVRPFLSSSWVAFGRPSNLWAVLPGVPQHWRFPPASGGHPPRLIPPSGGYCLAPEAHKKGECRRGWRYFWPCRTRVDFRPATGPTLKTALCHIRALVGRFDKYRGPRGQRSPRTFSKPMYGTRPCCLDQAITQHTCPDPHLGSWNCLPHQAHIAPSEPMSSIDQQGSRLGSFLPPPLYPSIIGLRAFDLVSSPVWWEAATNKQRSHVPQRQINIGLHLSRCRVALQPAVLSAARIWPSVSRYLEISFGLSGPSPQAFTPFGEVGFIARHRRRP